MIYYWKSIRTEGLPAEFTDYVARLKAGEGQSLDFEKLKGSKSLYVIRASDKTRLLFVNYKNHLIFLEVIHNHHYAGSKFLTPGVLKRFLDNHSEEYERYVQHGIQAEDFEQATLDLDALEADESLHAIDFYDGRFIELDDYQQEAMRLSLPLLVCGLAGTGKSFVGLKIMVQALEAGKTGRFLYVTKSHQLAQRMQEFWQEMPKPQGVEATVEFLSLKTLIQRQFATLPEFVKASHCQEWLKKALKKHQQLNKTLDLTVYIGQEKKIYEEFRLIAAGDFKDYEAIGEKPTFFSKEHRPFLWELFTRYQADLERANQVHRPFYRLPNDAYYSLIVADEAQDLPFATLVSLLDAVPNKQVCFCGDGYQTLATKQSIMPLLEARVQKAFKDKRRIDLLFPHRCPGAALQLLNGITDLRWRFAGGKNDKAQHGLISEKDIAAKPKGDVVFVSLADYLKQLPAPSPNRAFITTKDQVENVSRLLNTALVFTPSEIRGFEFNDIVLYNMFQDANFAKVNARLPQILSQKSKASRAKPGEKNTDYEDIFSELHIAFTRTKDTLTLVYEKTPKHSHFLNYLENQSQLVHNSKPATGLNAQVPHQVNTWEDQLQRFLNNKQYDAAKRIYDMHIKKENDLSFEHYLQPKPTAPAIELSPASPDHKTQTLTQKKRTKKKKNVPQEQSAPVQKTLSAALTLANVKQPQTAQTPAAYLTQLIESFDKEKLKKLVHHPKFWSYLLKVPFGEFNCLLRAIMANKQMSYVLVLLFSDTNLDTHNPSFTNICKELTTPVIIKGRKQIPLMLFLENQNGINLLSSLLICQNKSGPEMDFNFLVNFTVEELKNFLLKIARLKPLAYNTIIFKLQQSNIWSRFPKECLNEDDSDTSSFLYDMASTELGQKILYILFENLQFFTKVSQNFCKLRPQSIIPSVFHAFASHEEGIKYLRLFFSNEKLLLHVTAAITYGTLFTSLTEEDPADTAFLRLCHSSYGQEILVDILRYRKDILERITPNDLFSRTKNTGLPPYSAFELLAANQKFGVIFINLLIDLKVPVIDHITGQILSTDYKIAGLEKVSPLFFLLFKEVNGNINVLSDLFAYRTDIIAQIPPITFYKEIVFDGRDKRTNTLNLFDLLEYLPNIKNKILSTHDVLKQFIERRPPRVLSLYQQGKLYEVLTNQINLYNVAHHSMGKLPPTHFTPQYLFETKPNNKFDAEIEIILQSNYLTSIYLKFIKNTPPTSMAYYFQPMQACDNANLVPFHFLTRNENGFKVLHALLFKDEQELKHVDYLYMMYTDEKSQKYNMPIARMAKNKYGLAILTRLIELFPQKLETLKPYLSQAYFEYKVSRMNILDDLVNSAEGNVFLLKYLKTYPQAASLIYEIDLFSPEVYPPRHDTILRKMTSHRTGIELLEALLKANKDIISYLNLSSLTQVLNNTPATTFANLVYFDIGRRLLFALFTVHNRLAQEVKADLLCKQSVEGKILLFILMKDKIGLDVLQRIAEHNPHCINGCLEFVLKEHGIKPLMEVIFASEDPARILDLLKDLPNVIPDFKETMKIQIGDQTVKARICHYSREIYQSFKRNNLMFFKSEDSGVNTQEKNDLPQLT